MWANPRPFLIDALLAATLTALTLVGMPMSDRMSAPAVVLAMLSTAPIVVRRYAPVACMLLISGAMVVYLLLGYGGDFPIYGIGLLVGMFSVARHRPTRIVAIVWVLTMAAVILAYLPTAAGLAWSDVVNAVLQTVAAWALGDAFRRWAERADQRAEQATAQERARIARELHDIVGHHMAVIALQAGVAEYVLDSDPKAARTALAAVADSGRQGLAEMRRMLEVLRTDPDDTADYHPQPGLAQLSELADRIRAAGLPVELIRTGRARPLPPGADLCAYRVTQEALTNVLEHAGPATARVHLDYGENTLTMRVIDNGSADGPPTKSTVPHGIAGMRERAELYGGVLTAGPRTGGGFAVELRLPTNGIQ
ncbi:sensor histidine kinase [Nocardia sp. NPDC088792]|uniref:sensor histidine kinase n=1 Tax=Nocardia sp. NPDC088792 TaxID=3364332 RepID=UPI003803BD1E